MNSTNKIIINIIGIELDKVYNKYKYLFMGIHTCDDLVLFTNKIVKYSPISEEKNIRFLINSLSINKYNSESLGYTELITSLKDINKIEYKEDALEYYDKISKRIKNNIQLTTLMRIVKSKQLRPTFISLKEVKTKEQTEFICKKCPHCGHELLASRDTEYVVCGYGYTKIGYDWDGCKKDWCFQCNKKLCKTWNINELFFPLNRHHDGKCCKKHARMNGVIYIDTYCQCTNSFVNRKIIL
jgi:hypothetical protein